MDKLPGSMGTSAGLVLRVGQAVFSVGSVLFMCYDVSFFISSDSPFWFLVTTMGLVTPWSLGLAMIDAYLMLAKRPSNKPRVLSAVVIGDWVLSVLSLAVSCSTASVADYLIAYGSADCTNGICGRYQLSAAMAFLTWIFLLVSLLFNLWFLPTLY
ncbi:CASP-like protein 5C3 [Capsicum galapagoense]